MKIFDYIIIIIIFSFSIFFMINKHNNNSKTKYLKIKTFDNKIKIYPLNQNRIITNYGPIGQSIIVISNNYAYMKQSPCKFKICIKEGKISKIHQSIICIPNKIEAVIFTSNNNSLDAITR